MGISPEVEAKYENNRLRMMQVNRGFRRFMWFSIILGALIFSTSFFAGAASTLHDHQEGPSIFYYAMSSGAFQILFGLVTILLGWLTAMKNRVPSLISLGVDALGFLMILLGKNGTFSTINIIFVALGIALNVWAQMLCNANDELKLQPGYPLFSVQADYRAHYEIPADVLARKAQASTHMAEIGRAAANPETAPAAASAPNLFLNPAPVRLPEEVKLSAETEQSLGISEMTGSSTLFLPKAEQLAAPSDVSLDSLSVQTPQVSEAALPQVDAADLLADMTAIPSHATLKGNPDMLPTPEEVKARLAAMKKARAEHHPEG